MQRASAVHAAARNRLVASLCTEVLIAYAAPSSRTYNRHPARLMAGAPVGGSVPR